MASSEAGPTGRIRVIVIDCSDLDRSMAFWSAVLGVEPSDRMAQYWWTTEVVPGVRITLQRVDDAKAGKTPIHFDLASEDPDGLIAKAVELGGSIISDVEDPNYALTVVADPDGNEFCVNRRLSAALRGDMGTHL